MIQQLSGKQFLMILVALFAGICHAQSQTLDSLKLTTSEIPEGYTEVSTMLNKAFHPVIIYDNNDLVSDQLGEIKNKTYQSLKGRGDKGTVFIIELVKPMTDTNWVKPFLYGPSEMQPSAMHPEEFLIHGNFLIIWSFDYNSKIKKISMEKIKRILQS